MTPDRIQEMDKLKLNLERSLAMQKLEPLRPYSYVLAWPETEVILEVLAALAAAQETPQEGFAGLPVSEQGFAGLAQETPAARPAEAIKAANRKRAESIADYSTNINATHSGVFERVWAALNAVSGVAERTPAPPATTCGHGVPLHIGCYFCDRSDAADPGGPTR